MKLKLDDTIIERDKLRKDLEISLEINKEMKDTLEYRDATIEQHIQQNKDDKAQIEQLTAENEQLKKQDTEKQDKLDKANKDLGQVKAVIK